MKTLILKNITKKYRTGKNSFFTALKSTNLSFSTSGLTSIIGKSGSGKSTLINIITNIDQPTEGEVYFCSKPYKKFNKRNKCNFFNKDIGIVFQSYNLIEHETALYNVELPLLISGVNKKDAKEKALKQLKEVGISEEVALSKTKNLSGGEKQRVGIARAIINNPKVVLCDEPTGALDSKNSIVVMDILKTISKDRLVIIVSHNLQLVEKYSDRIIEISDGKIISDITKNKTENEIQNYNYKTRLSDHWVSNFSFQNFKRRFKRNLFSTAALTVCLSMFILICGFVSNKDNAVKQSCYQQLDYGSGTISKEIKTGSTGVLSLSKSSRPSLNELLKNQNIKEKFEICQNFDAILPANAQISYDGQNLLDLALYPVYNFDEKHIDHNLLSSAENSQLNDKTDLIINRKAEEILRNQIRKSPVGESVSINHQVTISYIEDDSYTISDTFYFSRAYTIKCLVNEISYLASPKIYYSYSAIEEYMKESYLPNLSTYKGRNISWYDRVFEADNNSYLSSYSYRLFLNDISKKESVDTHINFGNGLSYSSPSFIITNSLFDFLEVAKYGLILFLIITLIGTIIIISVISFTSYSEDRKTSAILSSIGASESSIQEIYLGESLLTGLLSLILSTGVSFGLSKLINLILFKLIEVQNLIVIPFKTFMGLSYFFPLLLIVGLFLILSISTLTPIYFSKLKSIKGELQSL